MTAAHDALVVGGGLAGSAFAVALAREGRDVALIEREAGAHDKVCGEFLSYEALGYLRALGLDVAALGAVSIVRVRLSRGRVAVDCPLPFEAASLTRRALDEALLEHARAEGVTVLRGRAVAKLESAGEGWRVSLDDGETIAAREAALASGKHDVRGHQRAEGDQNDLIGFKAYFQLAPNASAHLSGTVALGLFPGGYVGVEPVEDGLANLCLAVRRETFAALGRDWTRLLDHVSMGAPAIGVLLQGARMMSERPLAVARIPYGLVVRKGDGLWRLGDQAAVIPSFSGEGMSLALHGAAMAAADLAAGRTSRQFQARFAADVGGRVERATLLSRALMVDEAQTAAALVAKLFPASLGAIASATRIARPRYERTPATS